ncbi:hypothetical protein [Candidatus Palauibacter sp.]|uniref:hypothetical protein n=1 Tax=Candidatus Palauibacter sp. TaxID=3101350 RepID=UPI003B52405C
MKKRLGILLIPVVAAGLVVGCGGDDDPVEPTTPAVTPPPNLSGTYDLQSLTGVVTGNFPIGPPIAVGTFTLMQNSASGDTATGSLSLSLTVTDPRDGSVTEIADQGMFTVRTDGSWEQTGQQQQALGTYTLAGNVLTVIVTEPAAAVSTTVWQRQ